jgi:hypothetical protein
VTKPKGFMGRTLSLAGNEVKSVKRVAGTVGTVGTGGREAGAAEPCCEAAKPWQFGRRPALPGRYPAAVRGRRVVLRGSGACFAGA